MMEPFRKQFEGQKAFPFHFVKKKTKGVQHELPEHTHDWLEIVLIHEGKGTFFIDQTIYSLQKDDLIIIPSNTIHRTLPDKEHSLTSTAIYFSPVLLQHSSFGQSLLYLKIFEESKKQKNYKYSLDVKHLQQLNEYMKTLLIEVETENHDQQNAILLWLHMILLHLNRNCLIGQTEKTTKVFGPDWFKKSLIYIDQHLHTHLDLHSLSTRFSISAAHFSRIFKQLIGINVTNYIAMKRILLAKDLLGSEHEKITTIAEQCGFTSMPHFYRTFKRHTSMTPSEYRRNMRKHEKT